MTIQHPLDIVQQQLVPTVMVPQKTSLDVLTTCGHRFLAACDGLWIEVRTPWLYLRTRLAHQDKFPMPYGAVEQVIVLDFKEFPSEHILVFEQEMRNSKNLEIGAWITWSKSKGFHYYRLNVDHKKNSNWRYEALVLPEGESLVFELLSCGTRKPVFETTDKAANSGITFMGAFGLNSQNKIERKFELWLGQLRIPIEEVIEIMAMKEIA